MSDFNQAWNFGGEVKLMLCWEASVLLVELLVIKRLRQLASYYQRRSCHQGLQCKCLF